MIPSAFYFAMGMMILSFSGCMTVDSTGTSGGVSGTGVPRSQKGIYHKVQKKETLWRIAKTYQVDIDDIIRSNNIPNGAHLEENQLIFIPGADSVRDVDVPLTSTAVSSSRSSTSVRSSSANVVMTGPVKDDFGWPVPGRVVRSFGSTGSYLNRGIAIETQEGQPVVASRQGKVVFADYLSGYYYTVVLDHLDGYFTVYGFNSKLAVNLGDTIAKGDKVAFAGKKGATPLLYFEVRRNAKAENPMYFLPKS
ncbi:MAG: peptidoglycan DD-metalloendopeptidase family protein [Candidatus Omnitrophica bacterium]|nr:peptidoglycan DD-metalloendopeptidase family protein [Candidatus Omnitrophota bacterium]